ncbi:hypothetical protein FC959_05610 [Clostridium botulinum]|nr:hypothetical protein [Clostridium botulinum]
MLNASRWDRLKGIDIDFNYIKKILRRQFNYEIKEGCLDDFCKNINKYKELNEIELLNVLEKNAYKRLIVLSMKPLVGKDSHPVYEELTNDAFKDLFKERNRISLIHNTEFNENLGSCYKVTYYNEINRYIEIKLARVNQYVHEKEIKQGITGEVKTNVYDCCKFIIDLTNKLIFMFYNDVFITNKNQSKEVTDKKKAFYSLFTKATQGNLISYIIYDSLNMYFLDYMDGLNKNNPKKLVSIVEATNIIGNKKSTRSIATAYIHEKDTLDIIKNYIENKKYFVSLLECVVNSQLVKIKGTGEVFLESDILNGEVFENVCKEFFNYNKVYELCTQ